MRARMRIGILMVAVLLVVVMAPALAAAAPRAPKVPQWVTDTVNQVKAVARSAALARETADAVTVSNDEDGVALALERHVLST